MVTITLRPPKQDVEALFRLGSGAIAPDPLVDLSFAITNQIGISQDGEPDLYQGASGSPAVGARLQRPNVQAMDARPQDVVAYHRDEDGHDYP